MKTNLMISKRIFNPGSWLVVVFFVLFWGQANAALQISESSAASELAETEISLQRFSGVVVDENAIPAGGAIVWARQGKWNTEVVADSKGRFVFQVPRTERMPSLILARNEVDSLRGFVFETAADESGNVADLNMVLAEPQRVSVEVVDGRRKPMADVHVGVVGRYAVVDFTKTDASGQAELTIPNGIVLDNIFAFSKEHGLDYRSYAPERRSPQGLANETVRIPDGPIQFRLFSSSVFTVAVTDYTNRPLEGARVYPWILTKENEADSINLSILEYNLNIVGVATDENGIARIPWVPVWQKGVTGFSVNCPGFTNEHANYYPDNKTRDLAVQLSRLVPVTGVLTFADGTPAAGLSMRFHGVGLKKGESNGTSSVGTATTDDKGRFEMMLAPHQAYLGILQDKKFVFSGSSLFAITDKPPEKELQLVARSGTRLFGRVTIGDEKAPVPERSIGLMHQEEINIPIQGGEGEYRASPGMMTGANTDSNGEFEFLIGGGKYWISGPQNKGEDVIRFEIGNETEKEINFHLALSGKLPLSISVINADESNAPVLAEVLFAYRSAKAQGHLQYYPARTADNGTVAVERERFPAVLLARSLDGRLVGMGEIDEQQTAIEILVRPSVTVKGKLVDSLGFPLADKEMSYGHRLFFEGETSSSDRFGATFETARDGTFEIEGLVPNLKYMLHLTTEKVDGIAMRMTTVRQFTIADGEKEHALDDIVVSLKEVPSLFKGIEKLRREFGGPGSLESRLKTAADSAKASRHNVFILFGDPTSNELEGLATLLLDDEEVAPYFARFTTLAINTTEQQPDLVRKLAGQFELEIDTAKHQFQIAVVRPDLNVVHKVNSTDLTGQRGGQIDRSLAIAILTESMAQPFEGYELLSEANEQARKQNKRLLILETETSSPQSLVFSRFLDRTENLWGKDYVVVRMDRRWTGSDDIIRGIRGDAEGGVPWYAILDSELNVLATSNDADGRNIGLPNDDASRQHLAGMLKTTAIRMTEEEIESMVEELGGR